MWTIGRRKDRTWVWERELVAECEAFLSGHYARCLDDDGRPVPDWAWLNLLARSADAEIRSIAASGICGRAPRDPAWNQAVVFLAQEVLSEATRRGRTLAELQRSILVPLELALIGQPSRTDLGPARVVCAALTALAEHPTNWGS